MAALKPATPPPYVQETLTVVEIIPREAGVWFLCCDDEGSIYRLVTESGLFSWPLNTSLLVGVAYIFNVSVNNQPRFSRDKTVVSWMWAGRPPVDPVHLIAKQAKPTLEEVFQGQVIDGKYVNAPPNCPEFGVWKSTTPQSDTSISSLSSTTIYPVANYGGTADTQLNIAIGGYELPYKPLMGLPLPTNNRYTIVGLAYPFTGTGQNVFNPPRCYIMVLGNKFGP